MAVHTPIYRGPVFTDSGAFPIHLVETPDSGTLDIGDRITYTQIFEGKYIDCIIAAPFKGIAGGSTTWDGVNLSYYRVVSSHVIKMKGGHGRLTVVWEARSSSSGMTLPVDTFDLNPVDLNPALERHPYWQAGGAGYALTEQEINDIAKYAHSLTSIPDMVAIRAKLANTDAGRVAKAALMTTQIFRGFHNFIMSELEYTWTHHQWTIPTLNRRAYLETIPSSPLSSALSGFTSLRLADHLSEANGYYTYVRRWLCAAGSNNRFDSTIYDTANAP